MRQDYDLKNWKWPHYRRHDSKVEWACPHGVGHGGIHGCDGCCSHESFRNRTAKVKP